MSSDDLVNKIWYAAAYTTQLCSISASHGRQWPPSKASGWSNNASCISPSGTGLTVLVDGAKRDRTIWPGDMGVSTATAFATTGDTYSSRISLETLYAYQSKDGMLPYAGPPEKEKILWIVRLHLLWFHSSCFTINKRKCIYLQWWWWKLRWSRYN